MDDVEHEDTALPRPVLIIAIALGVALVVGVAGVGIYGWWSQHQQNQAEQARRTGPLAMPPIPAPYASSPECTTVLSALPQQLTVGNAPVPRREIAQPAPAGAAAWGDAAHDPMTVRCGIDAPAEFTPTSQVMEVNGVSWFQVNQADQVSYIAVDRGVRIALTTPADAGTGPLQEISDVLRTHLPKRPAFR